MTSFSPAYVNHIVKQAKSRSGARTNISLFVKVGGSQQKGILYK